MSYRTCDTLRTQVASSTEEDGAWACLCRLEHASTDGCPTQDRGAWRSESLAGRRAMCGRGICLCLVCACRSLKFPDKAGLPSVLTLSQGSCALISAHLVAKSRCYQPTQHVVIQTPLWTQWTGLTNIGGAWHCPRTTRHDLGRAAHGSAPALGLLAPPHDLPGEGESRESVLESLQYDRGNLGIERRLQRDHLARRS
ncbi:hypothetical protein PHLGIDRAFT_359692 [Phlebiopsis gigantea 11061_1 CR5-6]|uniref:Uncharacterized protein n=1 Tax=Phlebiopsis gigantea (strain 11061_1 CR5-6) TaxID=745531 RepID=A0A0C3NA84_PHLG1|nr:hypothetical protein PHLGIDRAFT_359692 [Phlebiopsis gigantea 11061_1 CR5-6]